MNVFSSLRPASKSLVALISIGSVGLAGAFIYQVFAGREPQDPRDVVVVKQIDMSEKIFLNGTVIARRSINLSPLTPGRLDRLFIEEGQFVRANQLIARMKNDELASLISQLEAQLQGAKAELRRTTIRLKRYERLYQNDAISAELIEQLHVNQVQASSSHNDIVEKLRNAKRQYEDSFIRAPFAGAITKRYAQAGEYVAPATPASNFAGATSNSIAELSSGIEIQVQVPEARLSLVKIGQPVVYETYAFPGKTFRGVIQSVSPRALSVQNLVNFPVVIRPISLPRGLKPGMEVKVALGSSLVRKGKAIPLAALVTKEDGSRGVYVLSSSDTPTFRKVELGIVSAHQVQVVKGIHIGEKVLISASKAGGQ